MFLILKNEKKMSLSVIKEVKKDLKEQFWTQKYVIKLLCFIQSSIKNVRDLTVFCKKKNIHRLNIILFYLTFKKKCF